MHPGDERRHRVLCDERGCTRRDVLPLRCAGNANDQSCERLRVQMRVGIDRDHERRRHHGEGCVQCVVLALLRLDDPSIREPEALTGRVRESRGVVGRVVVRDDDLHPTVVREVGDAFESADDRRALVPRGDQDRHRRPLAVGPFPLGRIERQFLVPRDQEREDHEPDHQAGDVGEEERDHPAHDGADRSLELASPWLGDPDAERQPREG